MTDFVSHRIEFSITFVPYRLFCPASLVIARGLAEYAFDPSFNLAEELLKRPRMEFAHDAPARRLRPNSVFICLFIY